VNDEFVESTIDAIIESTSTGQTGDGKIFIMEMTECVRIRTRERGGVAIG
jgi:nitrogen regulatory protein P-II 1